MTRNAKARRPTPDMYPHLRVVSKMIQCASLHDMDSGGPLPIQRYQMEQMEWEGVNKRGEFLGKTEEEFVEIGWDWDVEFFMEWAKRPENGGIDYSQRAALRAQLDAYVKALASDVANEERPDAWFLLNAHAVTMYKDC